MPMGEKTTITIGFLFLLVNMGITLYNFVHNRNKESKSELRTATKQTADHVREADAKELANKEFQIKTQMKLDQICNTTAETRTDIKSFESKLSDFDKRLLTNELTVASVDKRVQRLEATALGVHSDGKEE